MFDQAVGIAPCVAATLHRRLSQQNIIELLMTQRLPTEKEVLRAESKAHTSQIPQDGENGQKVASFLFF